MGFELDNGDYSGEWPEKQHPHQRAGTHPVGQKLPNPWGLYDMLGNVWEWCMDSADWPLSPYESALRVDPVQLTGSARVIRGASWGRIARLMRAASRNASRPEARGDSLGFRLARGPALQSGAEAGEFEGEARQGSGTRPGKR